MPKRLTTAVFLPAILLVFTLACASTPAPTDTIANADMAVRLAEQAGAPEFAPLEMRVAREKLDEARSLVQKGGDEEMAEARRLAEEALVQAQLAEQTARTAVAQKRRDEVQKTIDSMKTETDRQLQ